MSSPIKPWRTLESKYIVKDRWMTLRADTCETSSGVRVNPYYVQEPPDWVHIVAFNSSHEILLIEQYRHGTGTICVELPCGCMEQDEQPEAAMKRELLEETGCTCERLVALPPMSPNPARYNNRIYPFLGFGAEIVKQQELDTTEEIEFRFRPLKEVMDLVRTGEFTQALHTATLLVALDKAGLLSIQSG